MLLLGGPNTPQYIYEQMFSLCVEAWVDLLTSGTKKPEQRRATRMIGDITMLWTTPYLQLSGTFRDILLCLANDKKLSSVYRN